MSTTRPIVIGNWKMHGLSEHLAEIRLLTAMLDGVELRCDVAICPPATLLRVVAEALDGTRIAAGGQDCHFESEGAFTGDVSAVMLRDAGATYVILGHSERRQYHAETNALVRAKALSAHRAGVCPVVCIGESEDERLRGVTLDVIVRQLDESLPETASREPLIIAYEPVWAIGTGRTPTDDEIVEVHSAIRDELVRRLGHEAGMATRIVYGGSMKPANARAILALSDVDGGLVGQASLQAKDFLGIIAEFAPA